MVSQTEATPLLRPTRTPEEIRQRRKRDLALGYRILAALRWGDLGDGHISARDPEKEDCFWLLKYGVSYHRAMVSDLVLVGPKGELVEGDVHFIPAGTEHWLANLSDTEDLVAPGWYIGVGGLDESGFNYMGQVTEEDLKQRTGEI